MDNMNNNECLTNRSLSDLFNILSTFQSREDDSYFTVPKNIMEEFQKRGVGLMRYIGRSKPMSVVCGKIYGVTNNHHDGQVEICDDSGETNQFDETLFQAVNAQV